MESKITINLGSLSVEYEGPEDYLRDGLFTLIEQLQGISINVASQSFPSEEETTVIVEPTSPSCISTSLNLSVDNIAAKLGVKNARDVTLAASAYLAFVEQKSSFSRQEILNAMKRATSYYKQSMGSNLSKTLARMVKDDELLQGSKGAYSLSASCRKRLENDLRI
ncbi:MAG: hypothetical protein V8R29_04975 [Eggerthellaceae bacterium]